MSKTSSAYTQSRRSLLDVTISRDYSIALQKPNNLANDHPCIINMYHRVSRIEPHFDFEAYLNIIEKGVKEYNGTLIRSRLGHSYAYIHFETLEDAAAFLLTFAH